ncbi:hypothetical protein BV898_09567 [Hypsibius exemplaris]|uniref:F-box domain-containing protein n=1 Tax=Hypsibius exemplaris TaxID=2072580 RepID=A0A1W0WM29_HYPEX|nr:hypothetical protein BV898_09567 [Hypsibius exemplaris]
MGWDGLGWVGMGQYGLEWVGQVALAVTSAEVVLRSCYVGFTRLSNVQNIDRTAQMICKGIHSYVFLKFHSVARLNSYIPLELLELIFSLSDFSTRSRIRRVCRRWYRAGRHPHFHAYTHVTLDLRLLINNDGGSGMLKAARVWYYKSSQLHSYSSLKLGKESEPIVPRDQSQHTAQDRYRQFIERFASECCANVTTLVIAGATRSPTEWGEIGEICLDSTPRVEHPLFASIADLLAGSNCPNLETVVFTGVRICITSPPELHKLHKFLPGSVRRVVFHNINVVVAFLELPTLAIRSFHATKYSADLVDGEVIHRKKRRVARALMGLTNLAIKSTSGVAMDLRPPTFERLMERLGPHHMQKLTSDLTKIFTFRNTGATINVARILEDLQDPSVCEHRLESMEPITIYALRLYLEDLRQLLPSATHPIISSPTL